MTGIPQRPWCLPASLVLTLAIQKSSCDSAAYVSQQPWGDLLDLGGNGDCVEDQSTSLIQVGAAWHSVQEEVAQAEVYKQPANQSAQELSRSRLSATENDPLMESHFVESLKNVAPVMNGHRSAANSSSSQKSTWQSFRTAVEVYTGRYNRFTKEDMEQKVHDLAKDAVFPAVAVLMTSLLVSSYFSTFTNSLAKFMPECLLTVAVAAILGLFIRHLISVGFTSRDSFEFVDASVLNLVLLPIIIFNGAWSVYLPHFSSQFFYCIVFAVGGTLVTMFVMCVLFWFVSHNLGLEGLDSLHAFRECIAISALLSATDPVATLATYAELDIARRQPLLNTLVLGESLINDAVAIVFFDAVNSLDRVVWHGLHLGIGGRMFVLLFGSMLLGVLVASALIILMRLAKLPGQTTVEILYIVLAPFLVFSFADMLKFSGIIAVLFAGIMMKTYGTQHLTSKGRHLADEFLEISAKLADTGVFVLCGTSAALIDTMQGLYWGLVAVLVCLIARAAATIICSGACNGLKWAREEDPVYINKKHGFMIWLGGLRGGIALMLALELDTAWCPLKTKGLIINLTFFTICGLLLVCGGSTELCLVFLGMVPPPKTGKRRHDNELDNSLDAVEEDEDPHKLSDEHIKLGKAEDLLPGRVGSALNNFFTYVLVGPNAQGARRLGL